MKIKRVPPKRLVDASDFTTKAIQAIKNASDEELLSVLTSIQEIPKTKDDFYHWIDVMDKFDDILALGNPERSLATSESPTTRDTEPLQCYEVQGPKAQLVAEALRVTTLALESCASKNYSFYNSMEHLAAILTANDLGLVTSALDVLCALGRHRNQDNPATDKRLQSTLLSFAKAWPISQDLLATATDPTAALLLTPQAFVQSVLARNAGQLDSAAVAVAKDIVMPAIEVDSLPSVLLAELCRVNSLMLPTVAQIELLWTFKTLCHFADLQARCLCLRIRLSAICACVLADADLGPKLFEASPALFKDMLAVVATELDIPPFLRVASLRVYYAYAHGSVKINTMLHLFEINQPQGWLLSLLRKCARLLMEPAPPPSHPITFITAVFSLAQMLVPVPNVADLLIEGGIVRTLIPLLKGCKHIRLVTRVSRIVNELFLNAAAPGPFVETGILDHVARRLHAELEQCEPLCRASRLGALRSHKLQAMRSLVDDIVCNAVGLPLKPVVELPSAPAPVLAPTPATLSPPVELLAPASVPAVAAASATPLSATATAASDPVPMEESGPALATAPSSVVEPLCIPETKSFLKVAFRVLLAAAREPAVATAVRSLVEGHFLASLEMILRNPVYYGGTLWTESVRWVQTFCNNEPAQLSQLQEAGIMDAFFDSLRKVNYSVDVLLEVIRAISAFCLNARGLAAVVRAQPLSILVSALLDKKFTAMVGPDAAQKIGSLSEELLRHQPGLLDHGVDVIIHVIQRLLEIGATPGLVVVPGLDADIRRRERKWRAEELARTAASAGSAAIPVDAPAEPGANGDAAGPAGGAADPVSAAAGAAAAAAIAAVAAAAAAASEPDAEAAMDVGDAPIAGDAPAEMRMDVVPAEAGSPNASGRASPANMATAVVSLEVPLYDFISNVALFLHSIFTDRSAAIINAFVARDGLKLLVQILQMPALPQLFSLSSASKFISATFQSLAMIHTDTYIYLCHELSLAISIDDVQTLMKPENNLKVHPAVPKCLLYLDRLVQVGLELPSPEAESANLDWTDIARIAESLPRLDIGILVQLGAVTLEAKPTLATETAAEIYRNMSSRFVRLLSRIITPDPREPSEDSTADAEAISEATRQIVTAYIDSFNAMVSGPLTSAHDAIHYMGVLSFSVRQIKTLASSTSQRSKFNLELFNCLASFGGLKVVAISFRSFVKWLPTLFESSKQMPTDDEPLVVAAHKHPLVFLDRPGNATCAACSAKQPARLSRRCASCEYMLCTACCERAVLGPDTATFCSMIAGILRDLALLINPALGDFDAAEKLPAEVLKALKDMRNQLMELLLPLWSHELLARFPSFLLEAVLIGLRDIVAAIDLESLSATASIPPPSETVADERLVAHFMGMGFDRLLATRALIRTNNNLDESMAMLLTSTTTLFSDLGQSLADSMLGSIASALGTAATPSAASAAAAAAEPDRELTEEEQLQQAIALSMQTDSAQGSDAPPVAEEPKKPLDEYYENLYERITQCAMVCHNPKIVFAASSLLRVECGRDGGRGQELLTRLVSELASLTGSLSTAPLAGLLASPESRRLHALAHLSALLSADMVEGIFDIAKAQGLFGRLIELLSHTESACRVLSTTPPPALAAASEPTPPAATAAVVTVASDTSASSSAAAETSASVVAAAAAASVPAASQIPAWLGPCLVLLDCAERAALFAASPVKEVAMRWEVQSVNRPQYYDFIDHGWQPLSLLSMALLEREYVCGSRTALVRIDGHQCQVDFAAMVAIDSARESVAVRRIASRTPLRLPALPPRVSTFSGLNSEEKAALVGVCARLAQAPLDSLTLDSLALLSIRLTRTEDLARLFFDGGGIARLLHAKQEDSFAFFLSLLIRHVIEDEPTLMALFESEMQSHGQTRIPGTGESMRTYLERNAHLASRSPALFLRVAAKRLRVAETARPTDVPLCAPIDLPAAEHDALCSPAASAGMSGIARLLVETLFESMSSDADRTLVVPVSRILNLLLELCGAYSAFPGVLLSVPTKGKSSLLLLLLDLMAQDAQPGRSEEIHTCSTLASRLISNISRWNNSDIQASVSEHLHTYLTTLAKLAGEQRNQAVASVCSLLHTMIGRSSNGTVNAIANLMIAHNYGKALVDLLQQCDLQSTTAPATIDAIMKVLEPLARLAITHAGTDGKDKEQGLLGPGREDAPMAAPATEAAGPAPLQVVAAPATVMAEGTASHVHDEAAPDAAETFEDNAVASDSQSDDDQVLEEIFADGDGGAGDAAHAAEAHLEGGEEDLSSSEEHDNESHHSSHHSSHAGSNSGSGGESEEDGEDGDIVEEINVVLGNGDGAGADGHDDDGDEHDHGDDDDENHGIVLPMELGAALAEAGHAHDEHGHGHGHGHGDEDDNGDDGEDDDDDDDEEGEEEEEDVTIEGEEGDDNDDDAGEAGEEEEDDEEQGDDDGEVGPGDLDPFAEAMHADDAMYMAVDEDDGQADDGDDALDAPAFETDLDAEGQEFLRAMQRRFELRAGGGGGGSGGRQRIRVADAILRQLGGQQRSRLSRQNAVRRHPSAAAAAATPHYWHPLLDFSGGVPQDRTEVNAPDYRTPSSWLQSLLGGQEVILGGAGHHSTHRQVTNTRWTTEMRCVQGPQATLLVQPLIPRLAEEVQAQMRLRAAAAAAAGNAPAPSAAASVTAALAAVMAALPQPAAAAASQGQGPAVPATPAAVPADSAAPATSAPAPTSASASTPVVTPALPTPRTASPPAAPSGPTATLTTPVGGPIPFPASATDASPVAAVAAAFAASAAVQDLAPMETSSPVASSSPAPAASSMAAAPGDPAAALASVAASALVAAADAVPASAPTPASAPPAAAEAEATSAPAGPAETDAARATFEEEFLAALPDDIRREVLSSRQQQQRAAPRAPAASSAAAAAAAEASSAATDPLSTVNPEFLAALPEHIRQEVIESERREQQRQARATQGAAGEMDTASMLATLPADLRSEILLERCEDEEFLSQLPAEMALEARRLRELHRPATLSRPTIPPQGIPMLGGAMDPLHQLHMHHSQIMQQHRQRLQQHQQRQDHHAHSRTFRDGHALLECDSIAVLLRVISTVHPLGLNNFLKLLYHLCSNSKTRAFILSSLISFVSHFDPCSTVKDAGLVLTLSDHGAPKARVAELTAKRALEALLYLSKSNPRTALFFWGEHKRGATKLLPPSVWDLLVNNETLSPRLKRKRRESLHLVDESPINLLFNLVARPELQKSSFMPLLLAVLTNVCSGASRVRESQADAGHVAPVAAASIGSSAAPAAVLATSAAAAAAASASSQASDTVTAAPVAAAAAVLTPARPSTPLAAVAVPTGAGAPAASSVTLAAVAAPAAAAMLPTVDSPTSKTDAAKMVPVLATAVLRSFFVVGSLHMSSSGFTNLIAVLEFLCANRENAVGICDILSELLQKYGEKLQADLHLLHGEAQAAVVPVKDEDSLDATLTLPSLGKLFHDHDNQSMLARLLRIISVLRDKKLVRLATVGPSAAASALAAVSMDLDSLWHEMSTCLADIATLPGSQPVLASLTHTIEAFFLCHMDITAHRRPRPTESSRHVDTHVLLYGRKPDADVTLPAAFALTLVRFPEATLRYSSFLNSILAFALERNGRAVVPATSYAFQSLDAKPGEAEALVLDAATVNLEELQATCGMPREDRFLAFIERHKAVINEAVKRSPGGIAKGAFAVLIHHPNVLDFRVKEKYFRELLAKRVSGMRHGRIRLNVRRGHIFEDSYRQLQGYTPAELSSRIDINFEGEEGVDAGGVSRDWYFNLSRAMMNPNYALFRQSNIGSETYQPNPHSEVNPDHLQYFKFCGRLVAKAILDGQYLDCHFTRSFYKQILDVPVSWRDLQAVDEPLYKSLLWLLENDISGMEGEYTFSLDVDRFGELQTIDLKPDGRHLFVTEANKQEYVHLVADMKLTQAIRRQIDSFRGGFYELVKPSDIAIFDEQELELVISGLPNVDIDDLKANTEYSGYTPAAPQIQWFWRAVRSFTREQQVKLVQFVTGTGKIPVGGFSELVGMSGPQKFQIHKDRNGPHRLPQAHTCFNQLDVPEYTSYEQLRAMLLLAITEGTEGFGFA